MANVSLGKKVAGLMSLAIAFSGILLAGIGTYRLYDLMIEQKIDSSEQIARALASSALPNILTNDFISLQDSVDEALTFDEQQEILFIGIHDTNNRQLVTSSRLPDEQIPPENDETRKISVQLTISERDFGYIDMYISLNRIKGTVLTTIVSMIVVLAFVVTVSAVGMAFVAYRVVVQPVHRLADSARQISRGNLDLKISVNSRDELGELSNDFNRMAISLRERQSDLQIAYEKLERNYQAVRETYKQLRELDRMKSNFIAIVSHELRTPLALIRGYVETMAEGNLGEVTPRQQEKLTVVMNSVDRLSDIVDKSLDFSVIEQDRLAIEFGSVQLSDVLRQVLDEFIMEISERGLRLEKEFPDELPLMLGDRNRLHQVFHNLIANATEFTPEGGAIRIEARYDEDQNQNIVRVSDTGSGIPEEELDNLFSPFYQLESPVIRKHPGVGLGLAIAKGVVEKHGGSISVESSVGEGSTFTLAFPVQDGNKPVRNVSMQS